MAAEAMYSPITERYIEAAGRASWRDDRGRLESRALRVVKLAGGDIADGEVGGIVRRELTAQCLEKGQLEAVSMGFALCVSAFQVSGVIPPLGQIVVLRLILGEADGRERRLCRRGGGDFRQRASRLDRAWRAACR